LRLPTPTNWQIDDAVAASGAVVLGGKPMGRAGDFYEPTLPAVPIPRVSGITRRPSSPTHQSHTVFLSV